MKEYVLIIGFGKSGKWAYNLGVKWGYVPIVYDDEFMSVEIVEKLLKEISFAIVSPGVNDKHELIIKLHKYAIPIMSEIEFAYFFRNIDFLPKDHQNEHHSPPTWQAGKLCRNSRSRL